MSAPIPDQPFGSDDVRLVKIGGRSLADDLHVSVDTIVSLANRRCLLVHGYSTRLAKLADAANVAIPQFRSASGVPSHWTDETILELARTAASTEQAALVRLLRQRGARVFGSLEPTHDTDRRRPLLRGRRNAKLRYYDSGRLRCRTDDLSGRVAGVEVEALMRLTSAHDFVVLAPILDARDGNGPLVCDADLVTAELALALGISSVAIITATDGFLVDGRRVPRIRYRQIPRFLEAADGGMVKKLKAIRHCLAHGVQRVELVGTRRAPSREPIGTVFDAD